MAQLNFKLSSAFVNGLRLRPNPYNKDGLAEFVYRRTYSRPLEQGQESWVDTIERVVNGTFRLQEKHLVQHGLGFRFDLVKVQDQAQQMAETFFDHKALPPGRGLWAMGSPISEDRHLYAALNNCAFVSTAGWHRGEDPVEPFLFLMDISMLGVGTGFDTKGAGAIRIPQQLNIIETDFVIPDSREGWVEAFKILLEHYVKDGPKPNFDFKLVRPAGMPIKGFGGVSGGPEPLKEMLQTVGDVFERHRGRTLGVAGIVDIMNMIGRCIVSGNVRRTAEIAFGEPDDVEFLELKNYGLNPHRANYGWTSNNSVFAEVGHTDYESIMKRTWATGEPGIVWLDNMRGFSRMKDARDDRDARADGTNPCVTGDTIITTTEGPRTALSLVGKPFYALVNGERHHSPEGFFKTGVKPIYRILTDQGYSVRLTENHKVLSIRTDANGDYKPVWVEALDLRLGDRIMLNNNRSASNWEGPGNYDEGYQCARRINILQTRELKRLPVTSYEFHRGFFRGCLDIMSGVIISDSLLLTVLGEEIANATQMMLINLGVRSTYDAKVGIIRVDMDDVHVFAEKMEIMTVAACTNPHPLSYRATVCGMEIHPPETVYDCNVETIHRFSANGLIIHNCVEQTLENFELCNLGETFPHRHRDFKEFKETLKMMHLYTKTVTLGRTHWPRTNSVMDRNRRMGISMSGIFQFISERGYQELEQWCDKGYHYLKKKDRFLSQQWSVPESIKLTSVKPSGTVSLLVGATPGIHAPINSHYIRRVRLPTNSSWITPLIKAGYHVEKAVDGHNTSVVEFPVNLGDTLRCQHEVSAFEQLANAAFMQRHWADNSVSCTISFDPEVETPQTLASLLRHFDAHLKGISFLPTPKNSALCYAQPPYEPITLDKYHELAARVQPIDWDEKDSFVPKEHTFCDNDKCEI